MPFGAIGGQAVLQRVYLSHFMNKENRAQENDLLEEAKQVPGRAQGTASVWNTHEKQNPR